jgi:S1-C subfamily serine protease
MAHTGPIQAQRNLWRGLPTAVGALMACVLMLVVLFGIAGCGTTTTTSAGSSATGSSSDSTTTSSTAPSSDSGTDADASPAKAAAAKLAPSVVNIAVEARSQGGFGMAQEASWEGSGVIYSSDGMIITNNHVVYDEGYTITSMTVTLATGEELSATLVGRDELTEIAVIKAETSKSLPVAEFETEEPSVGDYAIAIGSPFGFQNSVTLGIISGLNRTIDGASGAEAAALSDLIQTDAPINSGNSGGALASTDGKVIGINVAKLDSQSGAENLGFAIPSVIATTTADEIIKNGKATHAYIGIATQTVTSEFQEGFNLESPGVIVAEVTSGGPAEQAGIKQGDYVLKVDDIEIESSSDLLIAIRDKKPGEVVEVTIERDGQESVVSVTLQERPSSLQ